MAEYSNQKLKKKKKKLVDNKQVTKMIDKKKSYFTVAETPEVEGEQPSSYWEQGYKILKFFQKTIDKYKKVCYNNNVNKRKAITKHTKNKFKKF